MNFIAISIENDTNEDIIINLFDSREWNLNRPLNIKSHFKSITYDDMLHNLIANTIEFKQIHIWANSGDGLSYLSKEEYDYELNPLNSVIIYKSIDICGYALEYPIVCKAADNKDKKNFVISDGERVIKIGNLSYLQYKSLAKTTVDFIIYK